MNIEKYVRKPFYVDAVQVDVDNMEEISEWCDGTLFTNTGTGSSHIQVPVIHPIPERQTYARVGDWVLSSPKGFKVYTDRAFQKGFDRFDEFGAVLEDFDTIDSERFESLLNIMMEKIDDMGKKLAEEA